MQLRHSTSITLDLSLLVLQAVREHAETLGVALSLVVVDAAGRVVLSAHMDGAPLLSREIALNKALTAVSFGCSGSAWDARLAGCSPGVRQGLPLQTGMALFGGGEPLHHDDQVIGAVGLSGASETQDAACAKAGSQALTTALRLSARINSSGMQVQDNNNGQAS